MNHHNNYDINETIAFPKWGES